MSKLPWYRRAFGRGAGHLQHCECEEVHAHASDYLEGDAPAPLVDRIKRHIGLCRDCDGWVNTLKATVGVLKALPSEPPPDSLKDRVRAASRE